MNDLGRHKILYAEDDYDNQIMVTTLLKFSEIEVCCASTVAETWQWAQTEDFDLYMLDSRFRDGNGIDLCRQLRRYAPFTPIVIYSGDVREAQKEKAQAAGASDYLTKPYFDDLGEAILRNIYKISREPDPPGLLPTIEWASIRVAKLHPRWTTR